MRRMLACLTVILAAASARADIAPTPDRGPPAATVAGLVLTVQDYTVKYPPGYTKTFQGVFLTGCTDGHANCKLAKAKNLIGMQVYSVDEEGLQPEYGMIRQVIEAFAHKKGAQKVTLELFARNSGRDTVKVAFACR